MVPDKQIETILSGPSDLKQKETALMDSALAAGGLDNITFQLVEIMQSPHQKSVFESKSHPVEKPKKRIPSAIRSAILLLIAFAGILTAVWMWTRPTIGQPPVEETIQVPDTTHIYPKNDTINHTI
jgi:hypothetical protein